jgi:hypothetical protein
MIMKPHIARKNLSPRFPGRAMLLCALALLAGVIFLFARQKSRAAPAQEARPAAAKGPSTYQNRSLLPSSPSPARQEAPKPTITGNVYSTDGAPIPGATVVAATFQAAGNLVSTASSAQSDARGRFELTLPEGTYQLTASMDGYGTTFASAHSGGRVSLVLPKSGVITGHVHDERRQPVRHFTIEVLSPLPELVPAPPPLWSKTFDSADGSFRVDQLPDWSVILKATAEDHAPAFSAQLAVEPGQTTDVNLSLSSGCTLTGKVEDRAGLPLPRVLVDAESRLVAGSSGDGPLSPADAVQKPQSEMDGSFRLEHVPMGEVRVRAYDGSNAVTTVGLQIIDCAELAALKVVMSPGGSIAGVARGADGAPLSGARILLQARSTGFVDTATDAEGRFRLDDLPAGMARLEVRHEGRSMMRPVQIKDGEVNTLDLKLYEEGRGEIRGRVSAGDKPLAGIKLMVTGKHGQKGGISVHYPVTDEDGVYRVPSLPDGGYVITALSTMLGETVYVDAGSVATVNLDVARKGGAADTN